MITVLGVLLGVDMQGFSREEGSDELPPGVSPQAAQPAPSTSAATSTPPPPKPTPAPAPPAPDVEMAEPEADDDAKAKQQAEAAKKRGADAYKARNLAEAQKAFSEAWELWPKDITYLNNLAGVFGFCPAICMTNTF